MISKAIIFVVNILSKVQFCTLVFSTFHSFNAKLGMYLALNEWKKVFIIKSVLLFLPLKVTFLNQRASHQGWWNYFYGGDYFHSGGGQIVEVENGALAPIKPGTIALAVRLARCRRTHSPSEVGAFCSIFIMLNRMVKKWRGHGCCSCFSCGLDIMMPYDKPWKCNLQIWYRYKELFFSWQFLLYNILLQFSDLDSSAQVFIHLHKKNTICTISSF